MATHICHNIIAIQWCWRAMALYQCKESASSNENGEIGVYADISKYLTEGGHSPFAVLRCHIHPITAISMQESSLPLFLMGPDMETFSFKSHPFTMSSFKDFAVALVASSESLMMSLLDSLDIVALDARIAAALSLDKSEGWFKDTLRDEDPGYSFLSDERNGFARYEDALMDHMCRKGSSLYAVHTPEGIQFKPNALLSFIDDVDDLVEHLFAALNFTWAGAARGTEIEDIRYRNGHSPRNLYFTNGVLTFVTFYNKTQHNAGRKSMIPRAVPPRLARLFILLLAVVYPCTKYTARIQSSQDHAVLYNSCIFVHRARPLNTERMSEILRRFTQEAFIFPLGVRDCHHLMKFILRHAVGLSLQDDPGDTPSLYRILDGLWGHSSKVSQAYYAVEEDTFSHIDAKDVTKAQVFSLAYHEWLGIGYEHLPANLRVGHAEQDKALTQIPPGKIDTAAFVQSLHATIPILGDALQATVSNAVHTYMAMHAIQPRPPPLHSLHVSTSSRVIVHPSCKLALEHLYGTSEPRFTSPQQAEIFELVMQNTRHVPGILPTGGGKSLMFYGPPLMESQGITIVVSPFVALANQQYREAKRSGIDIVQWPSSNIDCSTVRLLVVNAEHLIHGQLDDWLTAASKHGLIKRIIFDEAHEILVSSNYRDCYSKVQSLMDLGVTIVFLTATIYRQSIPELAKAFNIENLEVIAAPTLRTNIRYQVDTYGDEQLVLAFLIEACREAFEHAAPRDRLLIYCRSYDECDRVAATLRLPVHKSKYTDDPDADAVTRNRVEQDWLMGVKQGLVATTGFGTGINYPYVTHVFILNPYDMVTVTQQTGRLGRTGEVTYARIIGYTPRYRKPPSITGFNHAGKHKLYELFTTNTCRRISLGGFDEEAHLCHSVPGCTLCDYCENLENLPPIPPRYTYPIHDTRSSQEQVTHSSGGQSTSGSGGQITSGSSDSVTGSTSMIFDKSKRPAVHAYHDIADGHLNPPPTQTFFDKHAIRSVTSPLPSTSRPHGHHEALALNKQAGVTKRDLAQDRSQSFKRLVDMRDRCLTCQVFGRTPCGTEDAFRCPVGIYGYRCQYMVDGEALPTLYADVYKTALRNFDKTCRVCWICYFPFSYKTHSKDDNICKMQKDILSPIAWALFCLPIVLSPPVAQALQGKLLHAAGITTSIFQSIEIYSQWLAKPHPTVKNSANLVELCIAFEQLYHAKDWP
ncbi:P-loop containing nucleoside triphosphate hydrolase protein [Pleurotus eryngii]|uniref:DNA 3'-5' helicase n=1 Tax=Pleurotus eryngii TaxID=5323 RepID=A0A9P6D6M0_PLEER|nr:P-loop containing nucleoside triphosphate hydrolase protein [Pleurotus eryngii]